MPKLTALKVRSLTAPGRYTDSRGLMLVIGKDGSRRWVLRVQRDKRRRDIGLGPVADVSLAEAREIVTEMRRQIRQGIDPVAERQKARKTVPSFQDAALAVYSENKASWRNAKHAAQWLSTLELYAFPKLGSVQVDQIDGPMVLDVLDDIWLKIPETANRVRQRIGTVLDWAEARGFRTKANPTRAILRGLPKQPRVEKHLAALPWREVPAFIETLRTHSKASETVRLAFEFLILTAARSGEMRGTRWDEVDFEKSLWTVPELRMKAGRPHIVPLSEEATAILRRMESIRKANTDFVFPGSRPGALMSDMTLTMLLRRMGLSATVHGFRSSFRDWASEATSFPREVAEMALAHQVGSKVERSYARSDLLEKRAALMAAWGRFCNGSH